MFKKKLDIFFVICSFVFCSFLFQNCMKMQSSIQSSPINFGSTVPDGKVPEGPQGNPESPKNCPAPCLALSSIAAVNGQIIIPKDKHYFLDKNIDSNSLQVLGNLYCVDNKDYEIKVETLYITGKFICGTFESPYSGKLNILLKENDQKPLTGREFQEKLGRGYTDDEFKTEGNRTVYYRAIVVAGVGSELRLTSVSKTKMTRFAQNINPGDSTFKISSAVTNWAVGDEIAFSPIGGDYQDGKRLAHESAIIKSINGDIITVNSPLKNTYYGNFIEIYQGSKNSYTLDMSNEIINLSRNIKIQPFDPYSQLNPDQDVSAPGGHVMVHDKGSAFIDGVEFLKMGQAGIMGRYPFHWHLVGDGTGQFIRNSSIHHSFQRCLTVHKTNSTLVENNVCYNFRGHGIFLEDGDEIKNKIKKNVVIGSYYPHSSKELLFSDSPNLNGAKNDRFATVANFWISNPDNEVDDNIAAGCIGTGFWNSFEKDSRNIFQINTLSYNGNIAHACFLGHTWDGGREANNSSNNTNNKKDLRIGISHYSPSQVPVFKNMISYRNYNAMYFRGQSAIFEENIAVDNLNPFFPAHHQLLRNSIIAESSRGSPFGATRLNLYDGPFEIENVYFYNSNNFNFEGVGGSGKFSNIIKGAKFFGTPLRRIAETSSGGPGGASVLMDLDGSLGEGPGIIVDAIGFGGVTPGCREVSRLETFRICPLDMNLAILRVDWNLNSGFKYKLRRSSDNTIRGTGSDDSFRRDRNTSVMSNSIITYPERDIYEVLPFEDGRYQGRRFNEQPLDFKFFGNRYGVNGIVSINMEKGGCSVNAERKNSVGELRSSSNSSYYVEGSMVYIKFVANELLYLITPGNYNRLSQEHQTVRTISCP